MTGSFMRPKFRAGAPDGKASDECHQTYWLSMTGAAVVAPAEGVEVRIAQQGIEDDLLLLDLVHLDGDAGVLPPLLDELGRRGGRWRRWSSST